MTQSWLRVTVRKYAEEYPSIATLLQSCNVNKKRFVQGFGGADRLLSAQMPAHEWMV